VAARKGPSELDDLHSRTPEPVRHDQANIRQVCCMRSEEIQINDNVPLRAP
jgi:hypothetical protein